MRLGLQTLSVILFPSQLQHILAALRVCGTLMFLCEAMPDLLTVPSSYSMRAAGWAGMALG